MEPNKPVDVYKQIIDQLVEHSASTTALAVRNSDILSGDRADSNELIAALTARQRELLAAMLDEAHRGGIHQVLADLTWWMQCREVALTWRGQPMPFELSGMGLHGDYVGRLQGWEWPEPSPT